MKFRDLAVVAMSFISSLCITNSKSEAVIVSVKTFGMAGTGIAYPLDSLAGAFNPAGMADVQNRFDIGLTWEHARRKTSIEGNLFPLPGVNGHFDAGRKKDVFSPDFGINYALPYCFEFCNTFFQPSIGLVIYNRNFSKTRYHHPLPLLGTTPAGLEYIHETVSPVLAVKIGCRHNFGISFNWQYQRFRLKGAERFDNIVFSSHPGRVTNRKYSYSQGFGITLGYRCQFTDWLSFGVTYQPRTRMSRFKHFTGVLANHARLDIPRKIGAGIAIRYLRCSTIAFDVEHIQWKQVVPLRNPLLPNLFVSKLGRKDGAGFGFRNQTYYRFGIDYDLSCDWTIRAGFRHVNAPIRRSQTAVNMLTVDTVEDVVTIGATWCINPCSEISAFYGHGFNNRIKGHHSIPEQLGGGEANLQFHFDVLGISLGMNY